MVYSKRPFGGPDAVLAYLSRYTHRIAIANSRLIAFDGERVSFKWKDYRAKADVRYKLMTLDADEFIRRFLIHVLPDGFHRIRHYGLLANANRAGNIALARQLLGIPDTPPSSGESDGTENVTQIASGTLVLAAAGVWSSSRPSNPAASLGCGPSHRSGSTVHDHHAPVATPHTLPSDAAISPATPTLRRQRPSAAFRRRNLQIESEITFRSHPGRPTPAPSAHSNVVPSETEKSN